MRGRRRKCCVFLERKRGRMSRREDFLPVCRDDMERRGWDQCDFVYVIGDAYVDHSSFGPAIISRHLEAHGYRVGILSQPDWRDDKSITALGEPRLAFLVSGGNMDSMVNHLLCQRNAAAQMPIRPAALWENGRIMR